jgi:hypothetical protein
MAEHAGISTQQVNAGVLGLATLGSVVGVIISLTLWRYPLFPLQTDNLEWSVTWLGTSTLDFYGSTLCLCAIIVSSEELSRAIPWCLLCLLLGSPFSCAYVATRLWSRRTLSLASASGSRVAWYE